MKDGNLVITIFQDGFRYAIRALRTFGPIERTQYHNVSTMKVDDPVEVLEAIELKAEKKVLRYTIQSREFHRPATALISNRRKNF